MKKPDISTKKNRQKIVRSIIQAIILIFLLVVTVKALFTFSRYEPFQAESVSGEDKGFIAISYFGVDREGDADLISTKRLDEHLKLLHQNGYQTITQQDITNYYKNGTPLPEQALFLMFEDGRRDTAIFAQEIMEKYNFKATIMSYAEKFENDEGKFLSPKDLQGLLDTTFWELGTNGYRLSYINAFDRYDHYLGELTSLQYSRVNQYLGRNYNHFLMDFIRDEDSIPKEGRTEMQERISGDYKLMEKLYTEEVGYLPGTYVLMHANTGAFGNNDKVSAVNQEWIEKLFQMNYNREGFCLNNRDSSIYDLTRMQPQSYWYTNHLLMRIKDDTKTAVTFVEGDSDKKENWEIQAGVAEFTGEKIIITSESESNGRIKLKDNDDLENFYFDAVLTGNKLGEQTVYARANEDCSAYVAVKIKNNILSVTQSSGGAEAELFSVNLDEIDATEYISIEEDEKAALVKENEVLMKYASSSSEADLYRDNLAQAEQLQPATVAEGAEEYIADIGIKELGKRHLKFRLQGDKITVWIDDKIAVEDLDVIESNEGNLFLQAAWAEYGWSQRNLVDDVYDGVFEKLSLSSDEAGKQVLYTQKLEGFEKFALKVKTVKDNIINWFIKYL